MNSTRDRLIRNVEDSVWLEFRTEARKRGMWLGAFLRELLKCWKGAQNDL